MTEQGFLPTVTEWIFSLSIFLQTLLQVIGIFPAPCGAPLQYTLGDIDSRFGISEQEVLSAMVAAEKLWEDGSGKNLFEFNETNGIPVTLVYDDRQQKTQAAQELESKLEQFNLDKSTESVQAQVKNYEQIKARYEQEKIRYSQAANAYNQDVEGVNSKGGATEKQAKELENQYRNVQEGFEKLEQLRQKLNSTVGATNNQITQNQSLVQQYNNEVTTFQDLYGGEGDAFDQGVYTGNNITIYQYDDENRLILVLAHELGHALGIDHVEDSQALMHYLMRDQDVTTLALNTTDKEALNAICQKPTVLSVFGLT